ncbi:MAG: lipoate--protein ligase family protein [Acidimicrobiales bacterium]|nr:lipoate--protein ligase family protein [Acidimicrobiales bacterium]
MSVSNRRPAIDSSWKHRDGGRAGDGTLSGTVWGIERHVGSAASFHDRVVPASPRRVVWWFEVDRPAVALGSTQPADVVDVVKAERRGVEVVRRRSGGGAVWLDATSVTWVDVILPAADERWLDDVSRSAVWLGEIWAAVLSDLGVDGARVHEGRMERTEDSSLVCFAGRAPGEVLVDGRKVVGISQRRTRSAARFQCALLHTWDPDLLVEFLAVSGGERGPMIGRLAEVAAGIGPIPSTTVVAAFLAHLRAT